jgi:hypothetical protein
MILKLVSLFAASVSVAMCLALPSATQARVADRVTLTVNTRSIDGSLLFSDTTGWSWRCSAAGYRRCSVETERGRTMTVTAEKGAESSWWSWEDGPCGSSGPTCTLQVNDTEVSFTAVFSARLYVATFGPGSVSREKYPSGDLWRRACSGWTGSDFCGEYAYGEKILLRARPSGSSVRMTGWGGTCSNVPATSNCIVTMNATKADSATFGVPPPARTDCAPNTSCDPLTLTWRFYVQIWGTGQVLAPKVGNVSAKTCDAYSAAGFLCSNFEGPQKDLTTLRAFPVHGGRFLGWSGPCSGTGTCQFKATRTPIKVYAKFG